MADQDAADKTEEPTPKKLAEARKKGQIAQSKEVQNFALLFGMALVIAVVGQYIAVAIFRPLAGVVEKSGIYPVDAGSAGQVLTEVFSSTLLAIAPIFAVFIILGLLSGLGQSGLLFSTETLGFKLERISPISGIKRLFSLRSIVEFLKGLLKMAVVGIVAAILLTPEFERLEVLVQMDVREILSEVEVLLLRLLAGVVAIMAFLALADYLYQRYEHIKQLRMSRQEVKDEHKQSEGDPQVKARLRQIRSERARQRMMSAVPQADVVVTNPTHYAVALKYDMDAMSAPTLVAKGVDAVALRIRDAANENDVPIVENPPLARALYAGVEVDEQIPEEHYKAVAQVISYVYRLKGRRVTV